MTEHRIQLRRAWEAGDAGRPTRLDLPARWGQEAIPTRIARRFNPPRIEAAVEILSLEFASVPGLLAASLNDRDLGGPGAGEDPWVVGLTDLKPFGNRLILTLDAEAARRSDEWGRIAILIHRRSTGDPPVASPSP